MISAQKSSKNFYKDTLAENYDAFDPHNIIAQTLDAALSQVQKHVVPKKVGTLLDISLGTGESFINTDKFLEVGEYIGNDLSAPMLKVAKEKFPHFTAICDDAINITNHLEHESIDVIYSHFVFSYLSYPVLLQKMKQLLKKDGYLSVSTTTSYNMWELQEIALKKLGRFFNREMVEKYGLRTWRPRRH